MRSPAVAKRTCLWGKRESIVAKTTLAFAFACATPPGRHKRGSDIFVTSKWWSACARAWRLNEMACFVLQLSFKIYSFIVLTPMT